MSEIPGDSTAAEIGQAARQVMLALCGGRWVSPPVRFVDEYPVSSFGRVILSGRPAREVFSVKRNGVDVSSENYRLHNGYVLTLLGDARRACNKGDHVEVDYQYGTDTLPVALERAIDVLSDEMAMSDSNDSNCRIPDRVTSVSRQGVSWTLIDPQDFLTDGRTGIYEIDLVIKAFNPHNARRRARVFHPTVSAPALRRKP